MANNADVRPEGELKPRKLPKQLRAKERVERILDAAAELLDEAGVEALTTNLIAERAGVKISSLYQYFPNKYAVLAALAERMMAEQNQRVEEFLSPGGFTGPWTRAFDQMMDALFTGRLSQTGGVALRCALAAIPELAAVRERDREFLVDAMVRALKSAGAKASDTRLRTAAELVYDTGVAALDQAMRSNPTRALHLIAELKLMQRSYLAHFLD